MKTNAYTPKVRKALVFITTGLFFPVVALSAGANIPPAVKTFLGKVMTEILNPLIVLMFSVALLLFTYGSLKFIWNPEDESERETARRNMLWGIIGITIMVSAFGIIRFIIASIKADSSMMDYI
jgi:uncharacterized membrane protein YidH (DUF202 family)